MRAIALPMVLLMLTASLAGCTSDDPDEGGDFGIDTETLNQMIEDNLQDFINNTTVTVNQNIHYHNNTTVVNNIYETNNEYSNTTNMEGGTTNIDYEFGDGVNGSVFSTGRMYVVNLEWSAMDLFPDYFEPGSPTNEFSVNWTYWDYATNAERTDLFHFSCDEYYILAIQSDGEWIGEYWDNSGSYYDAWDNEYNDTIADLLQSIAYVEFIQSTCDTEWVPSGPIADIDSGYTHSFLNITIPEGYAITFRTWGFEYYRGDVLFEENYQCYGWSEGYRPNNGQGRYDHTEYSQYYGGWEEITIQFTFWPCHHGSQSIWPDSSYRLITYYELIPVTPME